jgi:hypothetical protein
MKKLYSMLAMEESASMLNVLLAYMLYINIVKRVDMEQYVKLPQVHIFL